MVARFSFRKVVHRRGISELPEVPLLIWFSIKREGY